jgi:steroid 5-alpha reductase family enzyme
VTLPQAPATALIGITVVLAAHRPDDGPAFMQVGTAVWGALVFIVAIVGETIADGQMKAFRANPANKGQVMDRGLWAWSRHPNYFFQWLGWMAFWIQSWDPWRPFWLTLLTLAAPAVMYGLLRYVSGVPPLEAAMLQSRGEKFRDYQRRVSVFFPLPPKKA